ncbi:MAG: exodeoxyribonuclease VII large subunit [Halofilum sp. (in: g-proteobacteria)]|nr:exodeoxyribonuclease VII large subunit [Halofilum sp. (in: g-proteobacteria)]
MRRGAARTLAARRERLAALDRRLARARPATRIAHLRERLARAERRLPRAVAADLRARHARVTALARALDAVSPLAVLGRGYALVRRADDGRPVTDAARVNAGDALDLRLARGRVDATVAATHPGDEET